MAAHKMIYSISGAYATEQEIALMKKGGLIDFWQVVHAGAGPDPNFVAMCNRQGVSPCFQNGNDGVPGWDGSASYYPTVVQVGYHAAGGESEQSPEMHAIMNSLVFGNFGGDFGGCTSGFSDVFASYHPMDGQNVVGHGMHCMLETYTTSVQLCSKVVDAAVNAKKHGAKEVGFMIGWWMPVTADPYIKFARDMEAQGYQCDGFNVWLGHGSNMYQNYLKWKPVFDTLMAIWPPNMTTLKDRFTGTPGKPTSQGLIASDNNPVVNEPVTITAQLKAGATNLVNKPVKIWHYFNNVLYTDVTKSTDNNGEVSLVQKFNSLGGRTYYADFAGDATYLKSTSPKLEITVSLPAPVLDFKVDKTHPELNEEVMFTVRLSDAAGAPIKGKSVTLSHKVMGATYTDGKITTADNGEATLKQKFGGSYCERPYFASFGGDTQYRASKAELTVYVTNKG